MLPLSSTAITAALVLCLSIGSATAQTDDDIKRALGEVAAELQVCSVYFMIGSSCLSIQEPELARTYREAGERVGGLAISSFRAVGLSDEAYAAQASLYTKAMMGAMHRNCTNIAVLLERYSKFCQRLSQDADPRLKEWISCSRAQQRSCSGPGLP